MVQIGVFFRPHHLLRLIVGGPPSLLSSRCHSLLHYCPVWTCHTRILRHDKNKKRMNLWLWMFLTATGSLQLAMITKKHKVLLWSLMCLSVFYICPQRALDCCSYDWLGSCSLTFIGDTWFEGVKVCVVLNEQKTNNISEQEQQRKHPATINASSQGCSLTLTIFMQTNDEGKCWKSTDPRSGPIQAFCDV